MNEKKKELRIIRLIDLYKDLTDEEQEQTINFIVQLMERRIQAYKEGGGV